MVESTTPAPAELVQWLREMVDADRTRNASRVECGYMRQEEADRRQRLAKATLASVESMAGAGCASGQPKAPAS